jgi:hypothetical protein
MDHMAWYLKIVDTVSLKQWYYDDVVYYDILIYFKFS